MGRGGQQANNMLYGEGLVTRNNASENVNKQIFRPQLTEQLAKVDEKVERLFAITIFSLNDNSSVTGANYLNFLTGVNSLRNKFPFANKKQFLTETELKKAFRDFIIVTDDDISIAAEDYRVLDVDSKKESNKHRELIIAVTAFADDVKYEASKRLLNKSDEFSRSEYSGGVNEKMKKQNTKLFKKIEEFLDDDSPDIESKLNKYKKEIEKLIAKSISKHPKGSKQIAESVANHVAHRHSQELISNYYEQRVARTGVSFPAINDKNVNVSSQVEQQYKIIETMDYLTLLLEAHAEGLEGREIITLDLNASREPTNERLFQKLVDLVVK